MGNEWIECGGFIIVVVRVVEEVGRRLYLSFYIVEWALLLLLYMYV